MQESGRANNEGNNNGTASAPTNLSPVFTPFLVNQESWSSFKWYPRFLSDLEVGASIILKYPALPKTVPQAYLLPYTGLRCYFSEVIE